MSPAPEKHQNVLICNSGPLNEQTIQNLDNPHSEFAFKSIQDFLRVKMDKTKIDMVNDFQSPKL